MPRLSPTEIDYVGGGAYLYSRECIVNDSSTSTLGAAQGWSLRAAGPGDLAVSASPSVTNHPVENSIFGYNFNAALERATVVSDFVVPVAGTEISFDAWFWSVSVPTGAKTAVLKFYRREMVDGAPAGSWAGYELMQANLPDAVQHMQRQLVAPVALSTFGLIAGKTYQLQVGRDPLDASDDLTTNFGWHALRLGVT